MSNTAPEMNQIGVEKELNKQKDKHGDTRRPRKPGICGFYQTEITEGETSGSRTQNLYWIQFNEEAGQTQATGRGVGLLYIDKQGVYYIHMNKKIGLVNLSRNSLSKGVICRL